MGLLDCEGQRECCVGADLTTCGAAGGRGIRADDRDGVVGRYRATPATAATTTASAAAAGGATATTGETEAQSGKHKDCEQRGKATASSDAAEAEDNQRENSRSGHERFRCVRVA